MSGRRTVPADHLRELIDRNGGFTLDLRTGRCHARGSPSARTGAAPSCSLATSGAT